MRFPTDSYYVVQVRRGTHSLIQITETNTSIDNQLFLDSLAQNTAEMNLGIQDTKFARGISINGLLPTRQQANVQTSYFITAISWKYRHNEYNTQ